MIRIGYAFGSTFFSKTTAGWDREGKKSGRDSRLSGCLLLLHALQIQ